MIQKILTIFALMSMISSCSNEPVHDVEYYINHQEERQERIVKCHNNHKKDDQNCINAEEAQYKAMFRGKSMPSIR